ncbi:hypothetical protein VR7878_01724 [Vibrio ruber DSM 16370]|uniref:Uncharacterized protein n=1 Tax=Vibrio ruber (strain DSM 16370 / JCM 11486 / BCRC 17186 / CECT 7878 / LMG 23124 / VR1) TaxID=1123498 RepID=A0A1R4LIC1_VIBR1|nr:hypothetical protein [Vibrio ruber]SJN56342.1 hypothetical protein VR7878_01724 [Vibrio ruber DSM 16370]
MIQIHHIKQWLIYGLLLLSGTVSAHIQHPDLSAKHVIDDASGAAALYRNVGVIDNQVIYKQYGIWQRGPVLPVQGSSFSNRHIGISNQLIVIGSRNEGQVWVFRRSGNQWLQEAILTPPSVEESSAYGESVYVDDHLIAVADVRQQVVYLYTQSQGQWQLSDTLSAEELPRPNLESFGITIRRVDDELYISDSDADRLLVFKQTQGHWQRTQVIEAPANDNSDVSVKFSFAFDVNRHVLAVSSYMMGSGYVRIYTRRHIGQPWTHTQTIYQSDIDTDIGYFGHDVELEGTTLLIGDDELQKIYRFDLNRQRQWQYSNVLTNDSPNPNFGYSFGFSHGTLLVGAAQSALYTHPFPMVTLFGRVLTQDYLPVQGAKIQGYLSQPKSDEYGEYTLDVPLFWSGTLQAHIKTITSQPETVRLALRDAALNDLVFEQPYYIDARARIISARRGCLDRNMKFAEIPEDQQRNASGRLISFRTLYGWRGTLTPVSDICQYSPTSIPVEFMQDLMLFEFTSSAK